MFADGQLAKFGTQVKKHWDSYVFASAQEAEFNSPESTIRIIIIGKRVSRKGRNTYFFGPSIMMVIPVRANAALSLGGASLIYEYSVLLTCNVY